MNMDTAYDLVSSKFNEYFFENCKDDDDLREMFDKLLFSLVEDHEIEGYDIIRAERLSGTELTFHFIIEGVNKIFVMTLETEEATLN